MEVYRRNLESLAQSQHDWADLIEAAEIPDTVEAVTGRDGSATFRLAGVKGDAGWLGGSSMPTVSGPALINNAQHSQCNIVLPDVMTGYEAVVLGSKLLPHCAVFVCSDDPLHVKLAMHLYDYSALLASGRLVLLPGRRISESLQQFFADHPGYDFPTQLLKMPQVGRAQFAQLQRELETAGRVVTHQQEQGVAKWLNRIAKRKRRRWPDSPRLAVITIDSRRVTLDRVRCIERGLDELGWSYRSCVPDRPDKCHAVARLVAIHEADPDFVLLVNCGPQRLGVTLPANVPLASWYFPETAIEAGMGAGPSVRHLACVCTPHLRQAVLQSGVDFTMVKTLEVPALLIIDAPVRKRGRIARASSSSSVVRSAASPTHDVLFLADLPEDRPEAANVTLPSHAELYDALRHYCAKRIDDYCPEQAPNWLDVVQKQTGIGFQDPVLRDQFIALIRTRIAPVALALALVRSLTGRKRTLRVLTRTGAVFDGIDGLTCDRWLGGAALEKACMASRLVLITPATGTTVQIILSAFLSKSRVVCYDLGEDINVTHPSLAKVLSQVSWFRHPGEAVDKVEEILNDTPRSDAVEQRLADEIQSRHSMRARLVQLFQLVVQAYPHHSGGTVNCGTGF